MLAVSVYASNIGANLLNKQMMNDFSGCPLSGCALILGIGSMLSFGAWSIGLQQPPQDVNVETLRALVPIVLLQCLTLAFTQLAVARLNLSLFHTIKATEPL